MRRRYDGSVFSISVVIPAYNEAAALDGVLRRCMETLTRCAKTFDITIVNDASDDGTSAIIEDWRRRFPKLVHAVHHSIRRGMARTFEDAYRNGRKEYVILLHGDGQYPPEMISDCIRALPSSDAVLMTRRRKFYGPYRHALSWGYRWIPRMFFGIDLRDPGCSKCLRRDLIESIPIISTSVFAEAERVIRAARDGRRITFMEVESAPRVSGVAQGGGMLLALHAFCDMFKLWWSLRIMSNDSKNGAIRHP